MGLKSYLGGNMKRLLVTVLLTLMAQTQLLHASQDLRLKCDLGAPDHLSFVIPANITYIAVTELGSERVLVLDTTSELVFDDQIMERIIDRLNHSNGRLVAVSRLDNDELSFISFTIGNVIDGVYQRQAQGIRSLSIDPNFVSLNGLNIVNQYLSCVPDL
jgi:hypothetical protein